MEDLFQQFLDSLRKATRAIAATYFRLAVSGVAEPIIRERAYAYELFHQLRLVLPDDYPFTLHGEVDKRGHPELGECLESRNPDLIVHAPGDTGPAANLVVLEAKYATRRAGPPTKDVDTLQRFITRAQYHAGILLLYGGGEEDVEAHVRDAFRGRLESPESIHLVWHPTADEAARSIPWQDILSGGTPSSNR